MLSIIGRRTATDFMLKYSGTGLHMCKYTVGCVHYVDIPVLLPSVMMHDLMCKSKLMNLDTAL